LKSSPCRDLAVLRSFAKNQPALVKSLKTANLLLPMYYAADNEARSRTSAEVAERAQWAQQKNRSPTSTPWPITLHWQCSQIGAMAWTAHSKLSNVWRAPAASSSKLLSYWLPQTSQVAMQKSFHAFEKFQRFSRYLRSAGSTTRLPARTKYFPPDP
jgi:hypothetical protein